jgi:glycosyltransferase involved in cell wall biosynthesis
MTTRCLNDSNSYGRSYEKNLVMLIRAFDLLQRAAPADVPEPKLVLVGDGPARSQLEQMCREMNIKAVFEGHLSGERLAESYASADVFAYVILLSYCGLFKSA